MSGLQLTPVSAISGLPVSRGLCSYQSSDRELKTTNEKRPIIECRPSMILSI